MGLGAGLGRRVEEGLAAEGAEADLHAVGYGVGGGAINLSLNEQGGDAIDVGEDGSGVFGEFEVDWRVGLILPRPRIRTFRQAQGRLLGTRIGDEDGAVVVGLDLRPDLAAEAGTAHPALRIAMVAAEERAVDGWLTALSVIAQDVSAELDHGYVPLPLEICMS